MTDVPGAFTLSIVYMTSDALPSTSAWCGQQTSAIGCAAFRVAVWTIPYLGMKRLAELELHERDVSKIELERMHAGFREQSSEFGNPTQAQTRHTFVLTDRGEFVGCVSGLRDNNWFLLSDLWLEKPYRKMGLGSRLLCRWEARVARDHITNVYTWTAGFEAPDFYKRQGYIVFAEFEHYYPSGHARLGLRKAIIPSSGVQLFQSIP